MNTTMPNLINNNKKYPILEKQVLFGYITGYLPKLSSLLVVCITTNDNTCIMAKLA